MHIALSPEQVGLLRELVEPVNIAHFDEECLPPGFTIAISFCGPYGNDAVGHCGSATVELGPVSVHPEQNTWFITDETN